jgi:hypothetical protein
VVITRVSLPYTNINTSLMKVRRVLRKGGKLWMTLHPIFFAYILLNLNLRGKEEARHVAITRLNTE